MVNRSIESDGPLSSYFDLPVSQRRRSPSPVLYGIPVPDPVIDEGDLAGFGSFVSATPEFGIERY